MNLSPMCFKDYVWPHNPSVYEIGFRREVRAHRVPFGLYALQNMGRQHRVLRGEGEYTGPGAYREFQRLAKVFYDAAPGILVHPLWDTTRAYFVSLALRQEPTENYVAYTFEFWECCDGYAKLTALPGSAASAAVGARALAADAAEYYTAVYGDCLWSVAAKHGLTLAGLLALNPQVKNPNILMVGDVLRVK